jgi:hypothetical protein
MQTHGHSPYGPIPSPARRGRCRPAGLGLRPQLSHTGLVSPDVEKLAAITLTASTRAENGVKSREKSWPVIQPTTTQAGMAKRLIWIELPTATPMDRSILFLHATITEWAKMATHGSLGGLLPMSRLSESRAEAHGTRT